MPVTLILLCRVPFVYVYIVILYACWLLIKYYQVMHVALLSLCTNASRVLLHLRLL